MGYYHKATQKDLEDLLLDVYEYMSNRSDVDDTESDVDHPQGIRPNEEMDLQTRTKFVLGTFLNINPETGEKYDMSKYPKTFPSNDEDDMEDPTEDPMDADLMGEPTDPMDDNSMDSGDDDMVNESIQKIRAQFKRFL